MEDSVKNFLSVSPKPKRKLVQNVSKWRKFLLALLVDNSCLYHSWSPWWHWVRGHMGAQLANALVELSANPWGPIRSLLFYLSVSSRFYLPHFTLSHRVRPANDRGPGAQSGCLGLMPGFRTLCSDCHWRENPTLNRTTTKAPRQAVQHNLVIDVAIIFGGGAAHSTLI